MKAFKAGQLRCNESPPPPQVAADREAERVALREASLAEVTPPTLQLQ